MAVRRIPPHTYTLKPRLDILTKDQRRAVSATRRHHSVLAEDEAVVLLSAIGIHWRRRHEWAEHRDTDRLSDAETTLKEAGLLHSDTGPHRVEVSPDVIYSLRYHDDEHIARELGEFVPDPNDPYNLAWRNPCRTNNQQ
jgi:hypothetical protein